MAYNEAQVAMAVEIASRYDGQVTSECLAEIRQYLSNSTLPKVTVYRWLQNNVTQQKAVSPEAKKQATKRLDDMFEGLARHALEKADTDEKMDKMNAQQLAMTAAISVDKMRLLRDLPTEIVGGISILNELIAFVRENHLDFNDTQRQFLDMLRAKKPATNAVQDGDA